MSGLVRVGEGGSEERLCEDGKSIVGKRWDSFWWLPGREIGWYRLVVCRMAALWLGGSRRSQSVMHRAGHDWWPRLVCFRLLQGGRMPVSQTGESRSEIRRGGSCSNGSRRSNEQSTAKCGQGGSIDDSEEGEK